MLTEAGRTFLPYAEAVLAALKDGTQAVQALQGDEHGEVSLAIVGTLAGSAIVEQLRRFSGRYRDDRIELRTANSFEVSDMVRRGEVNLGVRYFDEPSPQLVSKRISEETMVVVCSPKHRWAGRTLVDADRLRNHRWVGFPTTRNRHDLFAHLLRRQLAAAQLDDAPIMFVDSMTAQKRLVETGFALALLPKSGIQEELKLGALSVINVPALQTVVPIHVVYRKNGQLNGATRVLLSLISTASHRSARTGGRARRKNPGMRRRAG